MRKIILIATIILIFLIFLIFFLSNLKLSSKPKNNNQILNPTPIELNSEKRYQIVNNLLPYTPYETEDFYFDYFPVKNKFILEEKTPLAKEKFQQWLIAENQSDNFTDIQNLNSKLNIIEFKKNYQSENNLLQNLTSKNNNTNNNNFYSLNNSSFNIRPTPTKIPPIDLGFFTIYFEENENENKNINIKENNFFNKNKTIKQLTPTDNLSKNKNKNLLPINKNNSSNYIYYSQCNSPYANLALPNGCNMCQAGCGAATAAMIASSYLNNQYDPKLIIKKYEEKKYYLGCNGSSYFDARSLLESLGLKTTDFIYFNLDTADKIVDDLKKYLNAGWTFFALANFRKDGGGHFFWITEIDNNGNIWAYDPYYGRFQAPPINENSRYPFPLYRVAFGVKR